MQDGFASPGAQPTKCWRLVGLRLMLKTVRVAQLRHADEIVPEYQAALERDGSTLLVEYSGNYA